jgi:hypothetical protein
MFQYLTLLMISVSGYLPSPENPIAVTFSIFSDTTDQVQVSDSYKKAVLTLEDHHEWTAEIPGAKWIWSEYIPSDQDTDQTVLFLKNFFMPGGVMEGFLEIAADHSVSVYVNDQETQCSKQESSFSLYSQFTCSITDYLSPGMNNVKFSVTNPARKDPEEFNPAGLLYRITLRSLV